MPALPRVTLVRRFKASPESIFAAWTVPPRMTIWWAGGVRGVAQSDPRRGGRFLVTGRGSDGGIVEDWGVYTVTIPGEVLEFSWCSEPGTASRVTVQLLALADKTELTLVHFDLPDWETCEAQRAIWARAFDALDRLVDPPAA
jgi:uncharacterized protein YndB with AHSA1/START domain